MWQLWPQQQRLRFKVAPRLKQTLRRQRDDMNWKRQRGTTRDPREVNREITESTAAENEVKNETARLERLQHEDFRLVEQSQIVIEFKKKI